MVVRNVLGSALAFCLVILILIAVLGYLWPDIRTMLLRDTDAITIFIDDVPFEVAVADTLQERSQGLSGTPPLASNEGMLFIFDEPNYYGFWMKDMNYPIDILWFDNNRRLIHIEEDVRPESYPRTYAPAAPARFVVELAAFTAREQFLKEGAILTVPSIFMPDDLNPLQE